MLFTISLCFYISLFFLFIFIILYKHKKLEFVTIQVFLISLYFVNEGLKFIQYYHSISIIYK